jgi:hypothetical protein
MGAAGVVRGLPRPLRRLTRAVIAQARVEKRGVHGENIPSVMPAERKGKQELAPSALHPLWRAIHDPFQP